jgi:DNA-binding HxlR family transcriptional regulator
MERRGGYGQFCPVAKAAEIVAERWTPLVLRELLCGSHRFNDIHRGVPLMSKSLLSKRLKELEHAGLLERRAASGEPIPAYYLTRAGEELRPIIEALGVWGQRYVRSNFEHQDLDASLLLWDMRRWVRPEYLPAGRVVVEFEFPEQPANQRRWWLLKEPGSDELDLCLQHPGYDVDLVVRADLKTLSRIWVGDLESAPALRSGALQLEGSTALKLSVQNWISLSPFASV